MKKRLLSMKQVQELIPLSRAQLDRYVHDPVYAHMGFPKPYKIGFRVFFLEQAIFDWIDQVTSERAS
jgi:predicted DNA-binding transcriptional regulator AlpA